jgi:hypothetical protein
MPEVLQAMSDLEAMIRAIVRDELAKAKPAANEPTLTPEQRAWIRFGGGHPDDADPVAERSALREENRRLRAENERLVARLQRMRTVVMPSPSAEFRPRKTAWTSASRPGVVYAVALMPEVTPFRVKVGYTQKGVGDRLASYRTACPTAIAIGTWAARPEDEQRVHMALPGRIGESEVFVCNNIEALLSEIDVVFAEEPSR